MNALRPIADFGTGISTNRQWELFISIVDNGNPKYVSTTPHLGRFEMSVRRLCDLGFMTNPKRFRRVDRLVWSADWVPPYSLAGFLQNTEWQRNAFLLSMSGYAKTPALTSLVGYEVEGEQVTFSGVLAVAHRAGENGAISWFINPKDRRKFAKTTELFKRANRVF